MIIIVTVGLYLLQLKSDSAKKVPVPRVDVPVSNNSKFDDNSSEITPVGTITYSEYLQLSNSSGWKLYNADYDGISLNFKYPAGYTYYDKDFSTAISFYNGGLFDLEV